jgi:nucleoside-diphosphate-sugar epimerase
MRIVVVGGSGHVGTFLVPRLVRAGHEVINMSRGQRSAYVEDEVWQHVRQVPVDRVAEDRTGTFGDRVAALHPDVVVDMVCFTLESATALVNRLRGEVGHLVHCGSIWRYGPSVKVPVTEDNGAPPVGEYGVQKDAIARMLEQETRSGGMVTTSLHPGHISGPGWHPIGPLGNLDPAVWRALSAGDELALPGIGTELMHHVHADDVAQAFQLAVEHREAAAGEAFNVVAPSALTVRGYAELAASWFGQSARLRTTSWDDFRAGVASEQADLSWQHLWRSQYVAIDKARVRLGFNPAYEPEAAVLDAVRWLVDHGQLEVVRPLVVETTTRHAR